MKLYLQPIDFEEACRFIADNHSHHLPPQGWKFGIAVNDGEKIVGVVTIGRPVSRNLDDGWTLEVTRCCTDRTKNVASMLYGAAWRAVRAMGYKRLITYTLNSEKGTSLIAAGYEVIGQTQGGSWSRESRLRIDKHPLQGKLKWGIMILTFLTLSLTFASCLPKLEQPPIVEHSCVLEPLAEKPGLPPIEYEYIGDLLCLDPQNAARAVDRESLLREDDNYCHAAYQKALERCGK